MSYRVVACATVLGSHELRIGWWFVIELFHALLRNALRPRFGRFQMEPVGVVVQACLRSSTVPGLAALEVAGKTYLQHQLDRVLVAFDRTDCVVVTTELKENQAVIRICEEQRIPFYVGDSHDALGNCRKAAEQHAFKSVMLLDSGCPLIDPVLLVRMMSEYLKLGVPGNYVSNRLRRTYPVGMEAEITSVDNLLEAYLIASKWADFADPTVIIRRGGLPDCRRVDVVQAVDQSRWRFRLDTQADHRQLSRLLGLVQKYSLQEVMTVAEAHGLLAEDPRPIDAGMNEPGPC